MGNPDRVANWFKALTIGVQATVTGLAGIVYWNFTQDVAARAEMLSRVEELSNCKLDTTQYLREHSRLESAVDRLEAKLELAMENVNKHNMEQIRLLERLKTLVEMRNKGGANN